MTQGQPDLLAVAQQQPEFHRGLGARASGRRGAAPGAGAKGETVLAVVMPAAARPVDVEEHVLEAAPLDRQVLGEDVLAGAPRGQRGEQLRRDLAGDQVAPGPSSITRVPGGSASRSSASAQSGPRPAAGSGPRRRAGSARAGRARSDDPAGVDHDHAVRELLGLVEEVGGQHDA